MPLHPFFTAIKEYPELERFCRIEEKFQKLPEAYCTGAEIRAIIIGADPTNNGIRREGITQLDFAFGITIEKFEKSFFRGIKKNLTEIGLNLEHVFIQNLCRNYFL